MRHRPRFNGGAVVTDAAFHQARSVALDRNQPEASRDAAITELASFESRGATGTLLELASRVDESESISRAAGRALADLVMSGHVSEWDVRDLTPSAAEAFYD